MVVFIKKFGIGSFVLNIKIKALTYQMFKYNVAENSLAKHRTTSCWCTAL